MLAYWRDVASDFSRFHRVRRIEDSDLSGPEFFGLAYRLEVYGGAVALAAARARAQQDGPAPQAGAQAGVEMSFDDWVAANPALVIQAATRMGGERDA